MEFGFEVVAARRPLSDAPAQAPMRPEKLHRNPDTDTKKARRQQARQQKKGYGNNPILYATGPPPHPTVDCPTCGNLINSDLAVGEEWQFVCDQCGTHFQWNDESDATTALDVPVREPAYASRREAALDGTCIHCKKPVGRGGHGQKWLGDGGSEFCPKNENGPHHEVDESTKESRHTTAAPQWADGVCPQCGSDEVIYADNDDSDLATSSESWAECQSCDWSGSEDDVKKTSRRRTAMDDDMPDFGPVTPPPRSAQCPHCGAFADSDYDPTLDPPHEADSFTCTHCGTRFHEDTETGQTFARLTRGAAMTFRRFASDDDDERPWTPGEDAEEEALSEDEDEDEGKDPPHGEDQPWHDRAEQSYGDEDEDEDDDSSEKEARLLRAMAKATLVEQRALALELDSLRRARKHRRLAARELDLANAHIRDCLTPVTTHALNTTATDWVAEVESDFEAVSDMDMQNDVVAQASLWYRRTSPEVRADREEFAEQAMGMARRTAGVFGERAPMARRAFLDHVAHMHRFAESGSEMDADPSGQGQSKLPHEVPLGGHEETFDEDFWAEDSAAVPSTRAPVIQENASRRTAAMLCPKCKARVPAGEVKDEDGKQVEWFTCPKCGHHWGTSPSKESARHEAGEVPPHLKEHLFKPKDGGDGGDDGDDKPDWLKEKIEGRRVTSGRYCETHQVWIGEGNAANHDEACKIKEKATESVRRRATGDPGDWPLDKGKDQNPNVDDWFEDDDKSTGDSQDLSELPGVKSRRVTAARSISEIAAEIRRDWQNVNYAAVPYLDAMRSLNSVNDMYGADPASHIVMYFLSNARSWTGPKAKEIKAELKAMVANKGASRTAAPSKADPSGQGVSGLPQVDETGGKDDRPMWPWELDEGDPDTGEGAANVANVPTPGGEAGYPQPKKGRRQAGVTERDICGVCDDEIEKDESGAWKHKSGEKDHPVYQLTEMVFKNDRYTSSRRVTASDTLCPECGGPISFLPGDSYGITVYYVCPNDKCKSGKLSEEEYAKAAEYGKGDYWNKQGRRVLAEDDGGDGGGQTCSVCGDSIEKDPAHEDPQTWHHNNGEKHDHEATPGGGESKESRKRQLAFRARVQASLNGGR